MGEILTSKKDLLVGNPQKGFMANVDSVSIQW